jgi:glycosyltransferase involved in cell wall biosynthesis
VILDILGIVQGNTAEAYRQTLVRLAGADRRVRFLLPIPPEGVVDTLAGYDILAVPSRLKECAPLVVLDAFAAGIPVIGSNCGGIAEQVQDRVDGLLVEPGNVSAWAEAIRLLAEKPSLLSELRAGIRLPRTMQDVASQMLEIYLRALRSSNTQADARV